MMSEKNIMGIFAKNLYDLRVRAGLTQVELSERTGVSQSVISQLESAILEPNYTILVILAEALNCTVDYMLGLSKEPAHNNKNCKRLTPFEDEILSRLLALSAADREKVASYCEFLQFQNLKDKNKATA